MVSTQPKPLSTTMMPVQRLSYGKLPHVLDVPNLIQVQVDSFRRFQAEGLKALLDEISPIEDYNSNKLELRFIEHEFRQPVCSEQECHERDTTFAAPLYVKAQLLVKVTGEIKEQAIFMGDFPLMTDYGTFIINGAERVVVSQLLRSPGIYITADEDVSRGRCPCSGKLIPERGAWLEFETSSRKVISVKVDGKRKIPITTLLRAIGYSSDEELLEHFRDIDGSPESSYIRTTLEYEPGVKNHEDAVLDIYKRLRPGDPPSLENARTLLRNLLFNPRRYDLGKVGRYKLSKRLFDEADLKRYQMAEPPVVRVLTKEDLVEIVRHMIMVNNGTDSPDDIDHLGNRRVRTVGELIQNQLRISLLHLERMIRERMSTVDPELATPSTLVNTRPVVTAMREFFGGSQLSQFMDQTNPLAELTHKRRLSALGPGGLSRERAGFEVRDVHHSHYGRICPIETPEGPNIGLIGSLAIHAYVNEYGFIETPYRRVLKEVTNSVEEMTGRTLQEPVSGRKGKLVAAAGTVIAPEIALALSSLPSRKIQVTPFASQEIVFLTADAEEHYTIAQANTRLDERGQFAGEKAEVRHGNRYFSESPLSIDFMDVSPRQIVSVATALIPFLEHNDANRALMGSNMQRQSVPLMRPEAPLIGTGMEAHVARDSGRVVFAEASGVVTSVTSSKIVAKGYDGSEYLYPLTKFKRTNQGTCIDQHPIVNKGEEVVEGQVLADSSATQHGELALGQNVLCAFMCWEGYNFEDAIILCEDLLKEDKFSSIHIEKHEVEARDTKLGAEEITRDLTNVSEESLRNLDQEGIIRVGAEVKPGDILVGKATPKPEGERSVEEKLLWAIFGEKSKDVKDTSLRVPHGEKGKVIEVKVFSRKYDEVDNTVEKLLGRTLAETVSGPHGKIAEAGTIISPEIARDLASLPPRKIKVVKEDKSADLPPGVNEVVRVWVAQKRKISVGDKMAGRHGNKGVVARILPREDMPFLPDGRPVDIILNPLGVPSRMNIGQVLETHLGWAAYPFGLKILSPIFDGATPEAIEDALSRAWIAHRTGAANKGQDYYTGQQHVDMEKAGAWLKERGYNTDKVFGEGYPGEAKRVSLNLWLNDQGVEKPEKLSELQRNKAVAEIAREKRLTPPFQGKTQLYDGRTGQPFEQTVTVGFIFLTKLIHLVEDKVHARSTGPYSLITQQPLGGKAQFGGQRFGEMEVWALEAYGASHILQELLTVKSDDVEGRAKAYESIVKGEDVTQPSVPESFKVLVYELRSLGLHVELLNEERTQGIPFAKEELEQPSLRIESNTEVKQENA